MSVTKLNNVKIQVLRSSSRALNAVLARQAPPCWIAGIPHHSRFSWTLSVENQQHPQEEWELSLRAWQGHVYEQGSLGLMLSKLSSQ